MVIALITTYATSRTRRETTDALAQLFDLQIVEMHGLLDARPMEMREGIPIALKQREQLLTNLAPIVAPSLQYEALTQVASSHPGRIHLLQYGGEQVLQFGLSGLYILVDVEFVGNLLKRSTHEAIVGQRAYEVLDHLLFVVGEGIFAQLCYQMVKERLRGVALFAMASIGLGIRVAGNTIIHIVVVVGKLWLIREFGVFGILGGVGIAGRVGEL